MTPRRDSTGGVKQAGQPPVERGWDSQFTGGHISKSKARPHQPLSEGVPGERGVHIVPEVADCRPRTRGGAAKARKSCWSQRWRR